MITKSEYDLLLRALEENGVAGDELQKSGLIGDIRGFDPEFVDDVVAGAAPPTQHARVLPLFVRYAVAAVLVGIVAVAVWQTSQRSTFAEPQLLASSQIELPDGTRVKVAPGSSVTPAADFSTNRTVALVGEAFFDVAHDESQFLVRMQQGDVVVTGTRFNAQSWPELSGFAEVTLIEGAVEIRRDQAPGVALSPGQSIRFQSSGSAAPVVADTSAALAWTRGRFGFRNVSAASAFSEVARRFDIQIRVSDGVDQSVPVTYLSPRDDGVETVLSDLCHALNLRYRTMRGGYEVFPRK